MELVFFPLSIVLLLISFFVRNNVGGYIALAGNTVFSLSLLYCLFDVANRAAAEDFGGIADIYPTMKWCYLAMLIAVVIIDIALIALKNHKQKIK